MQNVLPQDNTNLVETSMDHNRDEDQSLGFELNYPDITKHFSTPEKTIHMQHSVSDIQDTETGKITE